MEGGESKAQSSGLDCHISPNNSTWLAENIEGFEHSVKEVLKLIEQDGVLSEKTTEMYDLKRSQLVTQIAEFSRMHQVLADKYDHLIQEVRRNHSSQTRMQHLDAPDSNSPQVTQMITPDHMSSVHKFKTPIGFDVLLSSGGSGSCISPSEGTDSSSSSSDTDSKSFNSINRLLFSPVNDDPLKVKETKDSEVFLEKIANLEKELVSLNTKLQNLEEENISLKREVNENESVAVFASNLQYQLDSAQHEIKTQNALLETEKMNVLKLHKQVSELQKVICESNTKNRTMGEELDASREKLKTAEDKISKLNHELTNKIFEETHRLERQLESTKRDMALLQKKLDTEETNVLKSHISVRDDQISELNTEIKQYKSEISQLKSMHDASEDCWKADIESLKLELRGKCESIEDLNKKFDAFKQKHDSLKSENDNANAQLETFKAEMRCKDNLTGELESCLKAVQAEQMGVNASFDRAQKLANELSLRVEILEREVKMQREVISETAEEKREAIRQLCFSLEHYRSGFEELRQAYIRHKRNAILAS